MQVETVLITGGTGLIGQQLAKLLREKGYRVLLLGRTPDHLADPPVYQWDYRKRFLEEEAISQTHYIIHLAGAGIGDKQWTAVRKKEIIESRTLTTKLLFDTVSRLKTPLKAFISSSAIGIYGNNTNAPPAIESDLPAGDFLAGTCRVWEESAMLFEQAGIRTVLVRTGLVLATEGGALPRLLKPIRAGLGSPLGTGKQFMPWIHMDDLCSIYLNAIENTAMTGPYNAVAPSTVTNKEFTRILADVLRRRILLPRVPSFYTSTYFWRDGRYIDKRPARKSNKIPGNRIPV
ncbi:MAG: TIGR01777 family oxidoreductase [Bacteroidales bacterium]